MALLSTVKVGSHKHDIHVATGEILDARKWATTTVSGGGGGGTVYGANGNVYGTSATAPIRSTTHNHAELFIRSADGKERVLEMQDEAVNVRTGNWVSLFWAIPAGKHEGPYVAIANHDTDRFSLIESGVDSVAVSWVQALASIPLFIGLLLAAGSWLWNLRGGAPPLMDEPLFVPGLLLMLPFPISWFRGWRRKRKFAADLTSVCSGYDADKRPAAASISAA